MHWESPLDCHWRSGVVLTPRRIHTIRPTAIFRFFMVACIYSVVPALFKFVGVPLLWSYPLTEDKVREIQDEIARKGHDGWSQ